MGITHQWNGTILTITSDSGSSAVDLKGDKGDKGERGARGIQGARGSGAAIEDGVISKESTWSSSGIMEHFAEQLATNGNPITCQPLPNIPLNVITPIVFTQKGKGEPYAAGEGKNLLPFITGMGMSSNGVRTDVNDEGRIELSGTPSTTNNAFMTYHIGVLNAGTYTLSHTISCAIATIESPSEIRIVNAANAATIYGSTRLANLTAQTTITLTADTDVSITFRIEKACSLSNNIIEVQLESGTTRTEWEPYENRRTIKAFDNVNVVRCGKNILESIGTSTTISGLTFTVNADKSIKVNGTATDEVFYDVFHKTIPAGTYTLSGAPISDSNKSFMLYTYPKYYMDLGNGVTFTFDKETELYIRINVKSGITCDNHIYKPQLEVGSTATTYEPYHGEVFTAAMGETVCEGYYDWNRGILSVERGFILLDGNTVWTSVSTSTKLAYIELANMKPASVLQCDRFTQSESYTTNTKPCVWANATKGRLGITNIDMLGATSAATLNAYFAENPTQIAYELVEPYNIQLTPQEISGLVGINSLYTDANSVSVIGRVDTMYQLSLLMDRVAALEKAIGGE